MHNPRMSIVPDEFLHATTQNEFLRGKMLITQVFHCDGYVLYLSNKRKYPTAKWSSCDKSAFIEKETVNVKLSGDVGVSGVSAGLNLENAWILEGGSGLFRKGYRKNGSFTPLYQVKTIKGPPTRRRETPDPDKMTGDR